MSITGLVSGDDPRALRQAAARMRGMAEGFENAQRMMDTAARALREHGGPLRATAAFERLVRAQRATSRQNAASARQTAAELESCAVAVERMRAALLEAARRMPLN